MNNGQLTNIVEALLFAAAEPLPLRAISRVLADTKNEEIERALAALNQRYVEAGASFRVREIAGGYQMCTMPEYAEYIESLLAKTKKQRLSSPALETLAVIAYRQPVSGPEIEKIRGVDSGGVLRTLLERKIVAIVGRSDKPGRPLMYGTTKEFLYYFGLNHLRELPRIEELEKLLKQHEAGEQVPIKLTTGMAAHFASAEETEESGAVSSTDETSATVCEPEPVPTAGVADRETAEEPQAASETAGDDDHTPMSEAVVPPEDDHRPVSAEADQQVKPEPAEQTSASPAQRLILKRTAAAEGDTPASAADEWETAETIGSEDRETSESDMDVPLPDDQAEHEHERLLRTAEEVVTSPVE